MKHQSSTVLDIVLQAAGEMETDLLEVQNGIFESSSSAVQLKWQALLSSAIAWLLQKQVNKTAYYPLIRKESLAGSYNVEKNITTFVLPSSYYEMLDIGGFYEYRIDFNIFNGIKLEVKGSLANINISYIVDEVFYSKAKVENKEGYIKSIKPLSDSDICVLDKDMVVKAFLYMYAKDIKDPTLEERFNDATEVSKYFLASTADFSFGMQKFNLGRD